MWFFPYEVNDMKSEGRRCTGIEWWCTSGSERYLVRCQSIKPVISYYAIHGSKIDTNVRRAKRSLDSFRVRLQSEYPDVHIKTDQGRPINGGYIHDPLPIMYVQIAPNYIYRANQLAKTVNVQSADSNMSTYLTYAVEKSLHIGRRISSLDPFYIENYQMIKPGVINVREQDIQYIETQELGDTLRVMSFDMECHASSENRFPIAEEGDPITIISVTTDSLQGLRRFIFKWYNDYPVEPVKLGNDILHVETRTFSNEKDMIVAFFHFINEIDPDIIIGHNVIGFDWPYLLERFNSYRIIPPNIARTNMGEVSNFDSIDMKNGQREAYGAIPICPGRIMLDTYNVFKYLFLKLKNNKIDTYARYFLGDDVGKTGLTIKELWQMTQRVLELGKEWKTMTRTIDGIVHPVENITDDEYHNWFDRWTKACRAQSSGEDYAVVDAELPWIIFTSKGMHRMVVEDCKVCYTRPNKHYISGSSYAIKGISLYTARTEQRIYNKASPTTIGKVDGAFVLPPIAGVHKYVSIVDYKSLYPCEMIQHNISADTIIESGMYPELPRGFQGKVEGDKMEFYAEYVDRSIFRGFAAMMAENLLNWRSQVKKLMKEESDSAKKQLLNFRQASIKVVNNSIYGLLGSEYSIFTSKECQATVTFCGRRDLLKVANIARKYEDVEVVGGDTDSVFLSFPKAANYEEVIEQSEIICNEINQQLNDPMELELETVGMMMQYDKRKNYLVVPSWKEGRWYRDDHAVVVENGRPVYSKCVIKGMQKKNIRPDIHKVLYQEYEASLIRGDDMRLFGRYLFDKLLELVDGDFPIESLSQSNKISEKSLDFKTTKSTSIRTFCKRMKEQGRNYRAGEFVETVVCNRKGTIGDRLEDIEMIRSNPGLYKPDIDYYIDSVRKAFSKDISIAIAQLALVITKLEKNYCREILDKELLPFEKKKHELTKETYVKLVKSGRISHDIGEPYEGYFMTTDINNDKLLTFDPVGCFMIYKACNCLDLVRREASK
jgi:DNA polymerase elongation subunit (family B)